jgi:hypothetical protein
VAGILCESTTMLRYTFFVEFVIFEIDWMITASIPFFSSDDRGNVVFLNFSEFLTHRTTSFLRTQFFGTQF